MFTDFTGKKFGSIKVVMRVKNDKHRRAMWLCWCEACSLFRIFAGIKFSSCKSKGCTCKNKTHGEKGTGTYNSWASMIQRCNNKNNPKYPTYGGRGIKICKRWYSYKKFRSDMGERPADKSIERLNNDKGYCPSNCSWATPFEQANNKSNVPVYNILGVGKGTCSELAKIVGIKAKTVKCRITTRGWTPEKAFTTPVQQRRMSNEN